MKSYTVDIMSKDTNSGRLNLNQANIKWFLSINSDNLPKSVKDKGLPTFRTLSIEGDAIEFSKGFTDLHTVSYQEIINGNGYGLVDARNSIEIVSQIRNEN